MSNDAIDKQKFSVFFCYVFVFCFHRTTEKNDKIAPEGGGRREQKRERGVYFSNYFFFLSCVIWTSFRQLYSSYFPWEVHITLVILNTSICHQYTFSYPNLQIEFYLNKEICSSENW
jgi:hypothetical protein